jgi:hypothetical protein
MGLWGVLFEIAKAVVPHAAPHVARAVVDAAKDRRAAANEIERSQDGPQPTAADVAAALIYLERRLSAAEDRAAVVEQKLSLSEARMADQWATARKWAIALLAWNGVVTVALIWLIVVLLRR